MSIYAHWPNAKAYGNSAVGSGEDRSGAPVVDSREANSVEWRSRWQQHCVSPLAHVQAMISAAHISHISRISVTPTCLCEMVMLPSVWESTHA